MRGKISVHGVSHLDTPPTASISPTEMPTMIGWPSSCLNTTLSVKLLDLARPRRPSTTTWRGWLVRPSWFFQFSTLSILDPSCQVLLLSGGSRRAPTPASTSTRLASPSWYCDIGNVFPVHLRLNFDMQELPIELKEDYLRRANLLMHPQEAAGHSFI